MEVPKKRTKDLTEAEILQFKSRELKHWMERVMARLHKLVEKAQYDQLTDRFVTLCQLGIKHARKGLVELVKVIQEKWQDPAPPTYLQVMQ